MDYCSIADMIDAATEELLIQLTDEAGTGTYDVDVLTAAIAAGKEEIDPYCRPLYSDSMPFTTIPGILKSINIRISIHWLYERRPQAGIPEAITDAYKMAVKKLENIAKGLIDLSSDAVAVDDDGVTFTNKTSADRIFLDPEGYK
jgi:phage gp36-like protein